MLHNDHFTLYIHFMKKIFLLFILLIHAVFVMAQLPLPFQKKVRPMPKAFGRRLCEGRQDYWVVVRNRQRVSSCALLSVLRFESTLHRKESDHADPA